MIYKKNIIYEGGQIIYQMTDALAGFLLPHMRPILYILISARSFVFCACILHQCNKIFAETIFKGITFLLKYYSDACTMLAEISLLSPSLGLSEKGRIIQNLCIFLVLLHCRQLQRTNPILLKKTKRIYRWACISRNALWFH